MFCRICNKKTQHPNSLYCRDCKKIKLPEIDANLLRAQTVQRQQKEHDEKTLQEKLNRRRKIKCQY